MFSNKATFNLSPSYFINYIIERDNMAAAVQLTIESRSHMAVLIGNIENMLLCLQSQIDK